MITKCLLIEKEVILILKPLVIFCNLKKYADISICLYFFKNFLVGKNHMNLCTKYNVYIMFLTKVLMADAQGALQRSWVG